MPGIFGGRETLGRLQRHVVENLQSPAVAHKLGRRDWSEPDVATGKQCGPEFGYCDPGDCCSHVGYCGTGWSYCSSPNCQFDWSDSCDASIRPLGEPTLDVPRPRIGNVTYDPKGVQVCKNPGSLALTFDDGPYNYTSHLLDVLASYGAKATFFITGNNLGKGQIDVEETGWPDVIRRMHREGHQIAGHTWGHTNLSAVNETEVVNQIHYLEMALRNILGFIPTYMRPPFTECRNNCPAVVERMGYHIIYQNVINHDWLVDDADFSVQDAKDLFLTAMKPVEPRWADHIFLQHDTHWQTAYNLTNYMLDYFKFMNFSTSITVGECMGDPPENWYRPAGGAPPVALLATKSQGSVALSSLPLLMLGTLVAFSFL